MFWKKKPQTIRKEQPLTEEEIQKRVKEMWKELQFEDTSINKTITRSILNSEPHVVVVEFLIYAPIIKMPYAKAHRLSKEELIHEFIYDY